LSGTTILFYNVENLFDTEDDPRINDQDFLPTSRLNWTEERLRTKLEHLAEAIALGSELLPVMVGLAEVEDRAVVEALAGEPILKEAGYEVVHFDSPDERGIDVALMYASDRFTLEHSEALRVGLDNDRTRDILYAVLSAEGHRFHVFVNHWSSRREGQAKSEPKRMAAAGVVAEKLAGIEVGPADHVIIMGDFNDTPTDKSIQVGLKASCDASGSQLVALMCSDLVTGDGSHQYNGDWQYLDQFLVDPGFAKNVVSAGAVHDDRLLFQHPRYGPSPDKTYSGGHYKGGYSDHLPVALRIR
jgi:predicted extracellular nuclease